MPKTSRGALHRHPIPKSPRRAFARQGPTACSIALLLLIAALLSTACTEEDAAQILSSTTYTIGGTISGLTGSGLVLQNNGGNICSGMGNGAPPPNF